MFANGTTASVFDSLGLNLLYTGHKAKNIDLGQLKDSKDGARKGPPQKKDAKDKSSATSKKVLELQERLPRARIVYVSATGASYLYQMAYMDRLGLWGKGTDFHDAKDFVHTVSKRGDGAMEMVAMDLKARGMFLSRMLSYDGSQYVLSLLLAGLIQSADLFKIYRYQTVRCDLSPLFRDTYDRATALWVRLWDTLNLMIERAADWEVIPCCLRSFQLRKSHGFSSCLPSPKMAFLQCRKHTT